MKGLPCLLSSERLSTETILGLPHHPISRDWYAKHMPFPACYLVALDPVALHFSVQVAHHPVYDRSCRQGEFREGLWSKDCAELFVREADSNRYQEFNLAPSGAWWSAWFEGSRKRIGVASPSLACAAAEITADGWKAWLSIDRTQLSLSPHALRQGAANVTLILNHPDEHFYSVADLGAGEPDFHRINRFLPWVTQENG